MEFILLNLNFYMLLLEIFQIPNKVFAIRVLNWSLPKHIGDETQWKCLYKNRVFWQQYRSNNGIPDIL